MRLAIDNVSKRYKTQIWALRDLSLDLGPGILGLLGPNGAGKSTLMRIIATITKPTCGKVIWNDRDVAKAPDALRTVLGYLPQDFGVYPHLNAVEFLEYLSAIKYLSGHAARCRIEDLLQIVGLFDARHRPLGAYSGGMKQRLGIAQALLNDPQLLIVDEPTSGLDPEERVRFRSLISELAGERIVILSTHIVSDVESIATRIAVLNSGTLLCCTTPNHLLQTVEGKVWIWNVPASEFPLIRRNYIISEAPRHEDNIQLRLIAETPPATNASPTVPTLEDAYLYIVSRNRGGGN